MISQGHCQYQEQLVQKSGKIEKSLDHMCQSRDFSVWPNRKVIYIYILYAGSHSIYTESGTCACMLWSAFRIFIHVY